MVSQSVGSRFDVIEMVSPSVEIDLTPIDKKQPDKMLGCSVYLS